MKEAEAEDQEIKSQLRIWCSYYTLGSGENVEGRVTDVEDGCFIPS